MGQAKKIRSDWIWTYQSLIHILMIISCAKHKYHTTINEILLHTDKQLSLK